MLITNCQQIKKEKTYYWIKNEYGVRWKITLKATGVSGEELLSVKEIVTNNLANEGSIKDSANNEAHIFDDYLSQIIFDDENDATLFAKLMNDFLSPFLFDCEESIESNSSKLELFQNNRDHFIEYCCKLLKTQ